MHAKEHSPDSVRRVRQESSIEQISDCSSPCKLCVGSTFFPGPSRNGSVVISTLVFVEFDVHPNLRYVP